MTYESLEDAIAAAIAFYKQALDDDDLESSTLRVCRQICLHPEDGCPYCYTIDPTLTATENARRCRSHDA